MPARVPRSGLPELCQAASDGDLDLLGVLLDSEDPVNCFQGDLNEHHGSYTALHHAAVNGQLECVQALLAAGADPHVRTRMPYGRDAADGRTAFDLADECGWDDTAAVLRSAEESVPKGHYLAGGPFNNAKIYPSCVTACGRDFDEVRRAREKLSGMARPFFKEEAETLDDVALVFPGQGSQYVGMLGQLEDIAGVASERLEAARQVLGWGVLEACSAGPLERLQSPAVAFPLLFVAGALALERLRRRLPAAANRPGRVAGFDVGELLALLAAGVLGFEDGLRVALAWGRAVEAAASEGAPQAVLSVAGLRASTLRGLCEEARLGAEPGTTCTVASQLFPKGCTVAGTRALVERVRQLAEEAGAVHTLLVPWAAYHTSLMTGAVPAVRTALVEVSSRMQPPTCDIYFACSGRAAFAGTSPKALIPLLLRQLTDAVQWDTTVKNMVKAGASDFFEVGPRQQLKSAMKRTDLAIYERMVSIEV